MSYLNTLNRLNHSPITDYHLAIMENTNSRKDIQKFFADETIRNLWTHITMVNTKMYNLERQYVIPSKTPSSDILADRDALDQKWQSSTRRYQRLKKSSLLFGTDKIERALSQQNSVVSQKAKKLNTEQVEAKEIEILSNQDFISSIAGMFTSGYSNTSENVKSIISESIQEKHGLHHGNTHR